MKTKSFLILATMAIFCSCQTVYVKPGATQADYSKDIADCDYQVSLNINQVSTGYNTMVGQEFDLAYRKREVINKCMVSKGWQLQRK